MTAWALAATVILAAILGALAAYLSVVMGAASKALDDDLAELDASIDADRAQRHRAGIHARPGGRGDCVVCGARCPYGVARPGA